MNQPDLTNVIDFWRWFSAHKQELDLMVDSDSALWAETLTRLKAIDTRFWFELSRPDGTPREFILTVEGAKNAFPIAEATIAEAPVYPDWRFIALKPAMGFDFVTRYEEIDLDPKGMWFLPLESRSRPNDLALRVGVSNLTPEVLRQVSNGVLVILDTALGERSAALDISHVEVCALPDDPDAEGFLKLPELPNYISWHKRTYGTA
jgi:hypothetical protein